MRTRTLFVVFPLVLGLLASCATHPGADTRLANLIEAELAAAQSAEAAAPGTFPEVLEWATEVESIVAALRGGDDPLSATSRLRALRPAFESYLRRSGLDEQSVARRVFVVESALALFDALAPIDEDVDR